MTNFNRDEIEEMVELFDVDLPKGAKIMSVRLYYGMGGIPKSYKYIDITKKVKDNMHKWLEEKEVKFKNLQQGSLDEKEIKNILKNGAFAFTQKMKNGKHKDITETVINDLAEEISHLKEQMSLLKLKRQINIHRG